MYYWWRDSVGTDVHGVVRVAAAFLLPRLGCLPFKNLGLRLFPEGGGEVVGTMPPPGYATAMLSRLPCHVVLLSMCTLYLVMSVWVI